jgi:hypothetical protein
MAIQHDNHPDGSPSRWSLSPYMLQKEPATSYSQSYVMILLPTFSGVLVLASSFG